MAAAFTLSILTIIGGELIIILGGGRWSLRIGYGFTFWGILLCCPINTGRKATFVFPRYRVIKTEISHAIVLLLGTSRGHVVEGGQKAKELRIHCIARIMRPISFLNDGRLSSPSFAVELSSDPTFLRRSIGLHKSLARAACASKNRFASV